MTVLKNISRVLDSRSPRVSTGVRYLQPAQTGQRFDNLMCYLKKKLTVNGDFLSIKKDQLWQIAAARQITVAPLTPPKTFNNYNVDVMSFMCLLIRSVTYPASFLSHQAWHQGNGSRLAVYTYDGAAACWRSRGLCRLCKCRAFFSFLVCLFVFWVTFVLAAFTGRCRSSFTCSVATVSALK